MSPYRGRSGQSFTKFTIDLFLASLLYEHGFAQQQPGYLEMGWNDTYYFGPDGPWQAVSVQVEGVPMSLTPTVKASGHGSWILPPGICRTESAASHCSVGGQLNSKLPAIEGTDFDWPESCGVYSISLSGNASKASFDTGPLSSPRQQWDASVMVSSSNIVTYPNGKALTPELGYFTMGVSWAQADFDYCHDSSCNPISYLYGQNVIQSVSWGMHIGSAALRYPGSLILGGYDKGRLVGPVITSQITGDNSDVFELLDVTLGVETGGSPFESNQQHMGGLLISEDGLPATTLVTELTTDFPYIFLPSKTIEAVVKHLPLRSDATSGYFLWDVDDPNYEQIVSSPAYLGFVFSATADVNVTIKVPMTLLNLTLDSVLSGSGKDVAYFPLLDSGDSPTLYLGKAFLQAAFWGSNWPNNNNTNSVSWLAQAPGPGNAKDGLGHKPTAIFGAQMRLKTHEGENIFNDSWSGHWTPLPVQAKAAGGANKGGQGSYLSGSAIAGTVVGVLAATTVILGIAVILLRLQRIQRREQVPESEKSKELAKDSELDVASATRNEIDGCGARYELQSPQPTHELALNTIHEMESQRPELQ